MWNPDEDFLRFLEDGFGKSEHRLDGMFKSSSGGMTCFRNILNEIREGTPFGYELYDKLYTNGILYEKFRQWRADEKNLRC